MKIDRHVGVIGLGLMGTAITERLLEHGYAVSVWNRTQEKADMLISQGAVWSDNPLADCRRVIVSLYTSEIVADVINRISKAMDVKGRKMIEADFSVQARLSPHFKDVRLMLDAATTAGLELPLTQTHAKLLAQAEDAGFGQLDNSAIINVYRKANS
jgi:3-hydroxyisobutyrate dehydrogenase-like beta-hydroxyacid dehydrogenase